MVFALGNTYNIGEIEHIRSQGRDTSEMCGSHIHASLSLTGRAICLTYRNGVLFRPRTRGDGVVGDDATANALRISNIPERLKGSGWPGEFEIREEALMPYESSFDCLNKEREDNEDPRFANPRNAASGSNVLDPSEVEEESCTLYHIPSQSVSFATHDEALNAAASGGCLSRTREG